MMHNYNNNDTLIIIGRWDNKEQRKHDEDTIIFQATTKHPIHPHSLYTHVPPLNTKQKRRQNKVSGRS